MICCKNIVDVTQSLLFFVNRTTIYTFAIYFSLLNIFTLPFLKHILFPSLLSVFSPQPTPPSVLFSHNSESLLYPSTSPKTQSLPFSFPQKPNSEIFLKTKTKTCNMQPLLFILRNHLLPPKSSPKTPVACDPSSLFLETNWSKLAQVADIILVQFV